MFRGSVPASVQRIVAEHVAQWRCRDIFVGCSGNFTIERVIAPLNRFNLHSNDVQLYSSAIGAYYAGKPLTLSLSEKHAETFAWLNDYLKAPDDTLATLLLAVKLAETLDSKGNLRTNPYYTRQRDAFKAQWAELHTKYTAKIKALPLALASFYCGDVVDWQVPSDAGFIAYPPFYGTSRDYEKYFARLTLMFDWQPPDFPPLSQERIAEWMRRVTARNHWMIGLNHIEDSLSANLKGMAQTSNRGVPIFIYASSPPVRVVAPNQQIEQCLIPRLVTGDAIGSEMIIAPLNNKHFRALRSQYMNEHIKPGQASASFGVLVDGKLIGVYALSIAPSAGSQYDTIYLLSDFAVAPTNYPRLSKLVLYAAVSNEARIIAERVARRRLRMITTTAFSANPISMKYRGIFTLISRKEREIDPNSQDHANQRYQLQYRSVLGRWSLSEALTEWTRKHGHQDCKNQSA